MKLRVIILALYLCCHLPVLRAQSVKSYTISNAQVKCTVDEYGNLLELKNNHLNHNFSAGLPFWRLYYDTKSQQEIQVSSVENKPRILATADRIILEYDQLHGDNGNLALQLKLELILEVEGVRFTSEIQNNNKGTIVREFQYPLIGNIQMPPGYRLMTTERGGNIYDDIKTQIARAAVSYRGPDHKFRQMNVTYPKRVASNCFALIGEESGLYFGSHDDSFVYTSHGIRLYPDDDFKFDQLELGFYKFPNCQYQESWKNSSNVIYPYQGSWHQTSKLYRTWVNTWWEAEEPPRWVKEMVGFQRVILKHQYGESFFSYKDFSTNVKKAGDDVGIHVGFPFGWWNTGMDNGYPDSYYTLDPQHGGRQGWKNALEEFKRGGNKVMLYYNGKLIDTESDYYRDGAGGQVSFKNATGNEMNEFYLFPANGSFTGNFNRRSFVVADPVHKSWTAQLIKMADDAIDLGADMVFYDQMGYAENTPDWIIDPTKEFSVPRMDIINDKAKALKSIRKYIHSKNPAVSLGIEHITDVTSQYVDFTHGIFAKGAAHTGSTHMNFVDWFRYTFPEVVLSARDVDGDERNLKWLINRGVLLGLRHNLAVHRLRSLVTDRPVYQSYLAEVNKIVEQYKTVLLAGDFKDNEGFQTNNMAVQARSYMKGNEMAIVMAHESTKEQTVQLVSPGYKLKDFSQLGGVRYNESTGEVKMPVDGLLVLLFEKII